MRYEDTPELFGDGMGIGTYGDIKCDICGTVHNEGEDDRGVYDGDSVGHTDFAGLTVCECCFERIENEVLHRMPSILKWYRRILNKRRERLNRIECDLKAVEEIKEAKEVA